MGSFQASMHEYKQQLEKGHIQKAYRGLMDYFGELRSHLKNKYPQYSVSSAVYYGFMDMTYFSFTPLSIKRRNLKIPVVFVHEAFRFEVWLAGVNRDVQAKYWKLIKENDWNKYHISSNPRGVDYIVDHILIDDPDFSDLDTLTKQIERGTLEFISDVEGFLSNHSN